MGLDWDEGVYNGASPVLDYQVVYAVYPDGAYALFGSGTTDTFQTVTGLTPGVTYSFKVKARNVIGYSELTEAI